MGQTPHVTTPSPSAWALASKCCKRWLFKQEPPSPAPGTGPVEGVGKDALLL